LYISSEVRERRYEIMRLTTQTEYGLICLLGISRNGNEKPVSVQTVSKQERMSKDYVEQLFLKMKKAGVLKSVKGVKGGYLLAKKPSNITLREIVKALEGRVYESFCSTKGRKKIVCSHYDGCSLWPVWAKLGQVVNFGQEILC